MDEKNDEELVETVVAMIKEGFDIPTIAKITKLSEDEISKLIKSDIV